MLDDISLNVAAAPIAVAEPTSWATMIIGFGAVGGAFGSSRRRSGFAPGNGTCMAMCRKLK